MSADNGVYILKTEDNFKIEKSYNTFVKDYIEIQHHIKERVVAYRVAHATAIDNFLWYEKNQLYMLGKYMHEVWGQSEVFYNENETFECAIEIEKSLPYVEYGICVIDGTNYSFN